MDSKLFFGENPNILSFSSSFLNEKTPDISKIIREIIAQKDTPVYNNTPSGLIDNRLTKNNDGVIIDKPIKKISFCTDFDNKINNILGLFIYEFCFTVLVKINIKYVLKELLSENKISECIKEYLNANMKFRKSQEFLTQFRNTEFYKFHFDNDTDKEIDPALMKTLILEKINGDLQHISFNSSDDIIQTTKQVLELLIDDSLPNLKINVSLKDVANCKFFGIALRLLTNSDVLIDQLGLRKNISEDIVPALINTTFPHIISLINRKYPKHVIEYNPKIIDGIINYFIELGMRLSDKIFILLSYNKSSRVQFVHIFDAMLNIPYSNLTSEERLVAHYILLSQKDIDSIYAGCNGNSTHYDTD
jgi:hypothetical protein